jgi:hypothetical protein
VRKFGEFFPCWYVHACSCTLPSCTTCRETRNFLLFFFPSWQHVTAWSNTTCRSVSHFKRARHSALIKREEEEEMKRLVNIRNSLKRAAAAAAVADQCKLRGRLHLRFLASTLDLNARNFSLLFLIDSHVLATTHCHGFVAH